MDVDTFLDPKSNGSSNQLSGNNTERSIPYDDHMEWTLAGFSEVMESNHLIPSATFRRFINSKASRRSCIIMPPKRRAIGRSTPQARKRRVLRASESDEQRALGWKISSTRHETRSSESSDQREVRLETDRIRTNQIRSSVTTELRERRLQIFE
ncbi:hypothetical protein TNCV_3972411 [Trichonephila clavipes]|nr:hypothetical protein TNCV_3972411 [Trichonephila clavipes]